MRQVAQHLDVDLGEKEAESLSDSLPHFCGNLAHLGPLLQTGAEHGCELRIDLYAILGSVRRG